MTVRKILRHRDLRRLDLESGRLVTTVPFVVDGARTIPAGVDVTEEARTWPTLASHVKRGAIVIRHEEKSGPSVATEASTKPVAAPEDDDAWLDGTDGPKTTEQPAEARRPKKANGRR